MAPPVKIKLASRAYDGILPILRGQMGIPGFDLDIIETEDVPAMFAGMFKGKYDVSEMSLGELIYYTSRDRADFVAIPVFPSRMFRHGFIFCRKASDIKSPAELSGKKIGFLRWVQTAAIWMRGMLVDEYGVSARDTQWYVSSMHHWDDADPGATVVPRDGSAIQWIQSSGKSTSERACRALFDGEVDALGVTESQLADYCWRTMKSKGCSRTPGRSKRTIFARQKSCRSCMSWRYRNDLAERHPELPAELFRLFSESKRWAQRWRRAIPSLVEAWPNQTLDEEGKVFETDPWAYGLEANRHVLDKFLLYCHAQGISARNIAPEELFHSSTVNLTE